MTQDEKAVLLDNALNNLESAIRSHEWHAAQMVYIAKSDDEANIYSACCDEAMRVIAMTRNEIFKLAGLIPPAEVNTVTASKTAPSRAGSWRKAGGVLSKSQGQQ